MASPDDLPVKGFAGNIPLSIEELIEQGERQMRAAHGKIISVKTAPMASTTTSLRVEEKVDVLEKSGGGSNYRYEHQESPSIRGISLQTLAWGHDEDEDGDQLQEEEDYNENGDDSYDEYVSHSPASSLRPQQHTTSPTHVRPSYGSILQASSSNNTSNGTSNGVSEISMGVSVARMPGDHYEDALEFEALERELLGTSTTTNTDDHGPLMWNGEEGQIQWGRDKKHMYSGELAWASETVDKHTEWEREDEHVNGEIDLGVDSREVKRESHMRSSELNDNYVLEEQHDWTLETNGSQEDWDEEVENASVNGASDDEIITTDHDHGPNSASPPPQSKLVQRVFGNHAQNSGAGGRGGMGEEWDPEDDVNLHEQQQFSSSSRRKQWSQPIKHPLTQLNANARKRMNGTTDRPKRHANGAGNSQNGPQHTTQQPSSPTLSDREALQSRMAELEIEISRYVEETQKLKKARQQVEAALQEADLRRGEVRRWAEAERAATSSWCDEQKKIAANERKQAARQTQLVRARAARKAATAQNGGTKAEVDGLKATVEEQKLELEQIKKKSRASEKRLTQQVKDQTTRIQELEAQVVYLERCRIEQFQQHITPHGPSPPKDIIADTRTNTQTRPNIHNMQNGNAKGISNKHIVNEGTKSKYPLGVNGASDVIYKEDEGGYGDMGEGDPEDYSGTEDEENYEEAGLQHTHESEYTYNNTQTVNGNRNMQNGAPGIDKFDKPEKTSGSKVHVHAHEKQGYGPVRYEKSEGRIQELYGNGGDAIEEDSIKRSTSARNTQPKSITRDGGPSSGVNLHQQPGDGRVEKCFSDGRKIVWCRNGTEKETFPDGATEVRFANGDIKRSDPKTGVVTYIYAAAATTHTTYPGGLEIFEFPSGQKERHAPDGTKEISFPDGTKKVVLASGVEESIFSDGVRVVEYPDGVREVTTPWGESHREHPDGRIEQIST